MYSQCAEGGLWSHDILNLWETTYNILQTVQNRDIGTMELRLYRKTYAAWHQHQ